jgi:O-antigen/teichoic acid export membrane protein
MARYAARGLAGDATGDPTGGQADAARLAERALRYMLLLILPLTLFIALVAPPVIRWFDRAGEFPASILVLQIVIWGLPFQAANTVFNRVLIAGGRERVFMAIALVALTVNVMLNLLFIPRYGYYGAGTATVISLAASCGMHYGFIVRARLRLPWTRAVLGTTGALLMAWLGAVAVVRLLAPSWGATWWSLPLDHGWGPFLAMGSLTAVFYAALAFGLRILRADDLGLVRQLLKGNG